MPDLSGCPKALIDQQLIVVLRDFFMESQIYQWTGVRISTKAGKIKYEATDYPNDYWPERVAQVVQFSDSSDTNGTKLIAGYDYIANGGNGIILAAKPDVGTTRALQITLVLLPLFTCTSIPTDFFNRYFKALAAGVKARCFAMPKTPWFDMQQASINQEIFNEGLLTARIQVDRGFLNDALIAKPGFRFA